MCTSLRSRVRPNDPLFSLHRDKRMNGNNLSRINGGTARSFLSCKISYHDNAQKHENTKSQIYTHAGIRDRKRAKEIGNPKRTTFPFRNSHAAPGDGAHRKGNSLHSRSLPPPVNHCNIRAGEYVVKPRTASARTFNPHAKLFAYRPTDRPGPSNRVIQLKLQPRSNAPVVACYRLKRRGTKKGG